MCSNIIAKFTGGDIITFLLTILTSSEYLCLFREHDWFKVDMPEYLFPPESEMDASIVDTEAVREVCEVKTRI